MVGYTPPQGTFGTTSATGGTAGSGFGGWNGQSQANLGSLAQPGSQSNLNNPFGSSGNFGAYGSYNPTPAVGTTGVINPFNMQGIGSYNPFGQMPQRALDPQYNPYQPPQQPAQSPYYSPETRGTPYDPVWADKIRADGASAGFTKNATPWAGSPYISMDLDRGVAYKPFDPQTMDRTGGLLAKFYSPDMKVNLTPQEIAYYRAEQQKNGGNAGSAGPAPTNTGIVPPHLRGNAQPQGNAYGFYGTRPPTGQGFTTAQPQFANSGLGSLRGDDPSNFVQRVIPTAGRSTFAR